MNPKTEKLFGYIAILATSLFYSGGVATAQLLGTILPRFELNVLRFVAQLLLSTVVAIVLRRNVFVISDHKDITILFGGACAYTWCVFSLNLAPLYAPVGNMEAIVMTTFIVLNVWVALLQCKASCAILIASILSCTGVVFLTQPDFIFHNEAHNIIKKELCPCFALEHNDANSRPDQCSISGTTEVNVYYYTHDSSSDSSSDSNSSSSRSQNMWSINDTMSSYINDSQVFDNSTHYTETIWSLPGMSSESFGYLISLSAGITFFIMIQVNEKFLLRRYNHIIITFWYGVIGCCLTCVVMLGMETPLPVSGNICTAITVAHCLFLSCTQLLINISLHYISAEVNAILQTLGVVLLFVAQSTVLKQFQPTHANAFEYIGAVLIVIACVLEPVYVMIRPARHNEDDEDDGVTKVTPEVDKILDAKDFECNEKTRLLIEHYPNLNSGKYSGV